MRVFASSTKRLAGGRDVAVCAFSIALITALGCSSTTSESASTTQATPEPTEAPEPGQTPGPEQAAAGECSAQLIRRAGLDTMTPECVDGIERLGNLPSADFECATDADCGIFMAARGCLGVNVSTAAHERTEPLYAACIADDAACATADFSDHRVGCRDGCCVIYEE